VDDLVIMRGGEAYRDLREHPHDALGRQDLLALEQRPQLLALEVLHHEGEATVLRLLEREDLDDVVVRERGADRELTLEALEAHGVLRDLGVQDF
jgi:hypothetical protein